MPLAHTRLWKAAFSNRAEDEIRSIDGDGACAELPTQSQFVGQVEIHQENRNPRLEIDSGSRSRDMDFGRMIARSGGEPAALKPRSKGRDIENRKCTYKPWLLGPP